MKTPTAPVRRARPAEPELVVLRRLAEELARTRTERMATGHLLAAIASLPGGASELLRERRLDPEVLLKAVRVTVDDSHDTASRALDRARELAGRSPGGEAGAVHLLFALCQERGAGAYRTLEQCGVDLTKLRTQAMQLAMGLMPQRRQAVARTELLPAAPPPRPPAPLSSTAADRKPTSIAQRPPAPATGGIPGSPVHPGARAKRPRPQAPSAAPERASPAAAPSQLARFALDPKAFPTLASLGKNLTLLAAKGELDPVIGREEEIERTLDVLAKKRANSPCLVGAAGVGKTAIVRGVARRIVESAPGTLDDRILLEIEPSALLSGTGLRGALAERLAQIKAEVLRSEGKVVLFFDNVHSLFEASADEGAAELKSALAKGELTCIGATTEADFRRLFEADPALGRRLTPIEIAPLSAEDSFLVLEQVAPGLGSHHHVRYTPEALASAITWSARYVPGRALPDQAIGLLDLAGAKARRRSEIEVLPQQVAEVVSEVVEVPVDRLLETDGERMLRLESMLEERIVGHGAALARIAAVLRRNASGFRSQRPIGSFLLLGPTGVGKTETAKAVAECLFAARSAMTRLDLSEFAEAHSIARLVGAPPGYVGHEAGGQLTEAVRKRPYQVVLLDEIEKAHHDVLLAFLQVLDEGQLTDGRGRTVDFSNTVILLTSNLGGARARAEGEGRIGFGSRKTREERDAELSQHTLGAARTALPPELYNRLDEVLVFAPLTRDDVALVARRMLGALGRELLEARGVRLEVEPGAEQALLDLGGYDPELGARPMRRAIARHVEDALAELLLRGDVKRGDAVRVRAGRGRVEVSPEEPPS